MLKARAGEGIRSSEVRGQFAILTFGSLSPPLPPLCWVVFVVFIIFNLLNSLSDTTYRRWQGKETQLRSQVLYSGRYLITWHCCLQKTLFYEKYITSLTRTVIFSKIWRAILVELLGPWPSLHSQNQHFPWTSLTVKSSTLNSFRHSIGAIHI